MNEHDGSPDQIDERLEGGDGSEQPYDPCSHNERPSIKDGEDTPPDQNQHEIPSSDERGTLTETGNAGERPELPSSPESPGNSTQLKAGEKGSRLESQRNADLPSFHERGDELGIGGERAGDRSAAREAQERVHINRGHVKESALDKHHRKTVELKEVR